MNIDLADSRACRLIWNAAILVLKWGWETFAEITNNADV